MIAESRSVTASSAGIEPHVCGPYMPAALEPQARSLPLRTMSARLEGMPAGRRIAIAHRPEGEPDEGPNWLAQV